MSFQKSLTVVDNEFEESKSNLETHFSSFFSVSSFASKTFIVYCDGTASPPGTQDTITSLKITTAS